MDAATRALSAGAAAMVMDDLDRRLGLTHDIKFIKQVQHFRTEYGVRRASTLPPGGHYLSPAIVHP